jgi:hypothetical protein
LSVKTEFTKLLYPEGNSDPSSRRKEKMNISKEIPQVSAKAKILLIAGVIAGPLFTIAWIAEGATRANYNPLRHPVSSLALGDYGWVQSANFIVAGLLMLAFSVGLRLVLGSQKGSTLGPLLIAIWAVGLIGAGIFITDPVSGYPLGTPDLLLNPTTHGALHDWFSLPGFIALTAACFVLGSRFAAQGERGWAFYSFVTGVLFPVGIVLASAGFSQAENLVNFGGLFQRTAVTAGWIWLTLLAVYLLRPLSENSRNSLTKEITNDYHS